MSSAENIVRAGTGPVVSPREIAASGLCIGCGSCAAVAGPHALRMELDRYGQYKPEGPAASRRERDDSFSRLCPFSPAAADEDEIAAESFPAATHSHALIGRYEAAFVGHAAEGNYREQGSSGGLVSWFAAELMKRGLVDGIAHVIPGTAGGGRLFRYTISRDPAALRQGAKSRYYPVELSEVITEIMQVPGRYAVIGVPCFIKAVRLRAMQDPVFASRVSFTLGLFCGHMKSARMAESFTWQVGSRVEELDAIDYRVKNPDRPANWYRASMRLRDGSTREQDWWHLADGDWGAGFFQNSACNFCDDVVAETADISFGDAWLEPYSSDGRGTNVVIVRHPLLLDITREAMAAARLALSEVDSDFVVATQAAGLRHRREGLSLRLALTRRGVRPVKRVAPGWGGLPIRRVGIYATRYLVSRWSHRVFWLARRLGRPRIYISWARAALSFYQGLAYSRGLTGRIVDRLGLRDSR